MAESAVSFLIEYLGPLLVDEAKLLKGVRGEARKIKDELNRIKSFLKDADAKSAEEDGNESLKTWVKQVREVAYDTEDVLNDFMLRVAQQQSDTHGVFHFLQKSLYGIKRLWIRHLIAKDIQDIQTRIQEIRDRRGDYALNGTEESSSSNNSKDQWYDPRLNSLFVEESELVGIDMPRRKLMEWLVEGESKLSVISVVGMGGLGKTTLVKKVYDSSQVKNRFQTYAWITVSQRFQQQDLLKSMIVQFFTANDEPAPQGVDAKTLVERIQMLRKYLENKSYLLALDDVWRTDVWDFIRNALPAGDFGNRVILTTRGEDVASSSCFGTSDHIFRLQPLSDDEAWSLFCAVAFKLDQKKSCPPEFENLSQKFVKKCQGLPLAIVTLGAVLRDKTYAKWEEMDRSLSTEFEDNQKLRSLKKILLLSFDDLPYYLKTCFLYLSTFPKGCEIGCRKLTRSWIAEGFVEKKEGRTLEEVAEGHLSELISRNLIQVVLLEPWGEVLTCRVHDLLHDMIVSKAKEQNFFTSSADQHTSLCDKLRRLVIYNNGESVIEYKGCSSLRSLFLFGMVELSSSKLKTLFTHSVLLKVVHLENVLLESFPDELASLFHLRYLSLMDTKIKKVPKSLGNLRNLETLDLRGTFVRELPVEIINLQCLRHLLVYHEEDTGVNIPFDLVVGIKLHVGICTLRSLQTLTSVEVDSEDGIFRELENLIQLRLLRISKLRSADGRHLCTSIEKMHHLRCLMAQSKDEEEALDLHSLSCPPHFLQKLGLRGRLEKLPHWIFSLQHLVLLNLQWSRLREDLLKLLQSLPNLVELELQIAYDGKELCCEAGGYPKLKKLLVSQMSELKNLRVEKGAMTSLEKLWIVKCEALVEIPSCLQHLTELKELGLIDMPDVFTRGILRDGGEDRWKVQHIPRIIKYDSQTNTTNLIR